MAGTISVVALDDGTNVARARFRDTDGVTREIRRTGRTKGDAKRRLQQAIRDRSAVASIGMLSGQSTVDELLDAWWCAKQETSRKLATGTRDIYEDIMSRIISPGLGKNRLHELTTGSLERFILGERRRASAQAELARTILKQALDHAARHDAIAANPMVSVSKVARKRVEPTVLTIEQLTALRAMAASMRQNTWLADIIEVQLGLALRIGETLALRTEDIELLESADALVRVCGTVITPRREPPRRQGHTKDGPDGRRSLVAPGWVGEILTRRAALAGPSGLLFASRNDTILDPHNVRETFRKHLDAAGLPRVKLHSLRKTALTVIAESNGIQAAADYAAHSSSDITARHYVASRDFVRDQRSALKALAPG
ncbi:tyrosine-type recombinase/integrase [Microcella daejeonensis]|uniref:site-specific integrase n=1 Tax=Microcella daejeonensis TaxID=2994971 RepID=UPI00226F4593|nr:tyrosine-type recombinase/integrase [Microcella daejeonensis]WAB84965.1 tyrosine-type recombinase/integrase [Microcella daejeonensis]